MVVTYSFIKSLGVHGIVHENGDFIKSLGVHVNGVFSGRYFRLMFV